VESLGAETVIGGALHALAHLGDLVGAGLDLPQKPLGACLLSQHGNVCLLGGCELLPGPGGHGVIILQRRSGPQAATWRRCGAHGGYG